MLNCPNSVQIRQQIIYLWNALKGWVHFRQMFIFGWTILKLFPILFPIISLLNWILLCSIEAAALLTYSHVTYNLFIILINLNFQFWIKHIYSISNTVQKSLASISPSKPIAASTECVLKYTLCFKPHFLVSLKFKICKIHLFYLSKYYPYQLNLTKTSHSEHCYLVPCFVRIFLTSGLYILLLAEK